MNLKKYGGYIALLIALILVMISGNQSIRGNVGNGMDIFLGPFVNEWHVPFYILIVVLSAITALYSSIVQKYTIDYRKMQDIQSRMKEFQKEFREAQLSQDEKRIKKLEAKKERVMQEQMEMSKQQFTPMAFIMLLTIPIFFWLLFRLAHDHSQIVMPIIGQSLLASAVLGPVPAWMLWYMMCSLTISQVVRKSLDIGGI